MKKLNRFEVEPEGILLLVENSLRAIPFNIVVAAILAADLIYNGVSVRQISIWFFFITLFSLIRLGYCQRVLKIKGYEKRPRLFLKRFTFLTFLIGMTWGLCYLLFLPVQNYLHEFIIILVFGGLCAGSSASLSMYLPAYYAYILPMFAPMTIYNIALFDFDRMVLATLFFIYILMHILIAKRNGQQAYELLKISGQKELLINELEKLSNTDPLTGLYNRRYFNEALENEYARAKRNQYPMNLISIDIDNFKLVNDNFGHPCGDKFLNYVADFLNNKFQRANDIVFRVGGDEFAVIAANETAKEIVSFCQMLQTDFNELVQSGSFHTSSYEQTVFDKVTLSIGVVHIPFDYNFNMESSLLAVDNALYQAKETKNRIKLHDFSLHHAAAKIERLNLREDISGIR